MNTNKIQQPTADPRRYKQASVCAVALSTTPRRHNFVNKTNYVFLRRSYMFRRTGNILTMFLSYWTPFNGLRVGSGIGLL
jgi:hypothetical protein